MQTNIQKITVQEKILHEKFVTFGRNAKEWIWKCSLLLPEIEKQEIWKKKGFGDIYEYAAKLAGMSHPAVDDALWVLKKIEDKPALLKVVETKGINAVRPVVTIATRENMDFWAEKAMQMSHHTLQTYVRELRKEMPFTHEALISTAGGAGFAHDNFENSELINSTKNQIGLFEPKNDDFRRDVPKFNTKTENGQIVTLPLGEPKKLVAMQLDPEILEQLEKLKGENGDWNDLMKQLLQMREEHLEEQKPEPMKTDSRHIPAKIDRYVTSRTNGQCAFPGCNKKINIKHHTQRFALEKTHDSDRLYGLCKAHERIAHLGLIENEDLSPKLWKVRKSADITSEIGKAKFAIDQIVQKFRTSPAGGESCAGSKVRKIRCNN
ncbi:MAG: hypothetical protein WC843_04355 [Candidatus Gracilibacteria bacterium]